MTAENEWMEVAAPVKLGYLVRHRKGRSYFVQYRDGHVYSIETTDGRELPRNMRRLPEQLALQIKATFPQ